MSRILFRWEDADGEWWGEWSSICDAPALHETSYVYERVLALGRMEWLAEEADMTMRSLMCLLLLPDGLETTVAFPAQRRTPAPRKRRGERGVVLNLDDYRRPR